MNVFWIMVDQLCWDYLSCYGVIYIEILYLDCFVVKGVWFNCVYVQLLICGFSCMSFYIGCYVRSYGVMWNGFLLCVGELIFGDYLCEIGIKSMFVGKIYMCVDEEGMKCFGIDLESIIGVLVSECGFDVFVWDDGINVVMDKNWYVEDYE